nr:male-specific lethal 3 homolog [Onthophagus taurus]
MVSTRGVKLKFLEGERVLCYEPDPTKAKVLYDSKVLEVFVNKDHRGRKVTEFLIHFQGWNSSWDRCVGEEFVLKDTPENRQLQKDLAEKSQLHLGAYLYRKERKKRKISDKANASSEDGSCGSPAVMEEEEGRHTSSSEESSSGDDEGVVLELHQELKTRLEHDYYLLHSRNKLQRLPATPNVVTILESYWKQYVSNQFNCLNEKTTKYRAYTHSPKITIEEVQRNLNLCREVLDGIRIYFDFTLHDLLLYRCEKDMVQTSQVKFTPLKMSMKDENHSKTDLNDHEETNSPRNEDEELFSNDNISFRMRTRRNLRSNRSGDATNGNGESSSSKEASLNNNNNMSGEMMKIPVWKALPEHVYSQCPPPPSLVFGVVHLTRLFVKLPDLLNNTCMSDQKMKALVGRFEHFLDFLIDHKEWFENTAYVEVKKQETEPT